MAATRSSKHHSVIIIGAWFNGIVAAKTYLQINPLVDLIIIDEGQSIGGVWSDDRIYPGLFYEMPTPLVNYSDFDMCKELGMEMWEDVSGDQVNEYLVFLCPLSMELYLSHLEIRSGMLRSMIL